MILLLYLFIQNKPLRHLKLQFPLTHCLNIRMTSVRTVYFLLLFADPDLFAGHTSSIRRAIFMPDKKRFASVSEDKTFRWDETKQHSLLNFRGQLIGLLSSMLASSILRLWDIASKEVVRQVELTSNPAGLELSKDGKTFTIPSGHTVSFWDSETWADSCFKRQCFVF